MSDRQESWQAYDEQGLPLAGKGLTKTETRTGLLHGAVHVWLWRRQNDIVQLLLQERSTTKQTWPGYLDVSAAGHIDLDEEPLVAALRETREEVLLDLQVTDLTFLFAHRQRLIAPGTDIRENEIQQIYAAPLGVNQQPGVDGDEVTATRWVDLDNYIDALNGRTSLDLPVVPHGVAYAMELREQIMRSING